jgi:arylsulfatase A-like enzyme
VRAIAKSAGRRARRIWSSLVEPAAPSSGVRPGALVCSLFCASLGATETARALVTGSRPSLAWLWGIAAGLALCSVVAICAGLCLDAIIALSSSGQAGRAGRWQRWLGQADDDGETTADRVGALLGALPPFGLYLLAAFGVTRRLVVSMAQPHFAAIAIVAVQLGMLALALALYPASRTVAVALVRRCRRVPLLGSVLVRPLRVVVATAALAMLVLGVFAWRFRAPLAYLPWSVIASVGAAVLLTFVSLVTLSRFRTARAIAAAGLLCWVALGTIAVLGLDLRNEVARRAVDETLGGRLGYDAARFVFDFDRDGHLSVLGGGDCAAFDRRRGPGEIDIPNNGTDEDCDGVDLDEKQLDVQVRRDFVVPTGFPRRPPVVLITIDAFAAKRTGMLGYARAVTPRLSAFAARSTLFRNGFSQGPSTRLSFPAIFTSRWDSQIKQRLVGRHPYPIEGSERMLAELMQGAGYDTVAVVSDGYFRRNRWPSITDGFAEVIDSPAVDFDRHNSVQVTHAALAALHKKRDRPLFLWVHYFDAHSPHVLPTGIKPFGNSRADIYDAELTLVDREVGRLLDTLSPGASEGGPLVIITGDHGIAFDAPRHAKFNYGYDLTTAVLHVPLIVHGPLIRTQTLDQIVSVMDIAPTIGNLLRISKLSTFEGASLVPELFDGRLSRPQRLVHEMFLEENLWKERDALEVISLRTERYNLIHNRKQGSFELYDWRKDYFETENLLEDAKYAQTLLGLKRQLALFTFKLRPASERSRQP